MRTQEDEYEWCKGFAEFQHLVLPHLAKTDRILIIGCGNSLMPMDLWRAGYRNVKSLDLSHAVISKMASRAASMVSQPALLIEYPPQTTIYSCGSHLRSHERLTLPGVSKGVREVTEISQVHICPKLSSSGGHPMLRQCQCAGAHTLGLLCHLTHCVWVLIACSTVAAYMLGIKRWQCQPCKTSGRASSHAALSGMQGMDSLTWLVGDMLDLQAFQAGYFDAVIEKGTMDVLFVDNDSPWDPSTRVQDRVSRVLDEIHR